MRLDVYSHSDQVLFPKFQLKKDSDIATTKNNLFDTMTLHCLSCSDIL